jgi:hypothetical protein
VFLESIAKPAQRYLKSEPPLFQRMTLENLLTLLFLLLVGLLGTRGGRRFLIRVFFPAFTSGNIGERQVAGALRRSFKGIPHYLFNDILIADGDKITQIDHVVLSTKGIFVIETKNLKGWIFGHPGNRTWTQTIYGRKYRMYNPLRQNHKHVKMMEKALSLEPRFFHSLVVFTNKCEIKTPMPHNVLYPYELRKYINAHNSTYLAKEEVIELVEKLKQVKLENTVRNRRRHRRHIKSLKRD